MKSESAIVSTSDEMSAALETEQEARSRELTQILMAIDPEFVKRYQGCQIGGRVKKSKPKAPARKPTTSTSHIKPDSSIRSYLDLNAATRKPLN